MILSIHIDEHTKKLIGILTLNIAKISTNLYVNVYQARTIMFKVIKIYQANIYSSCNVFLLHYTIIQPLHFYSYIENQLLEIGAIGTLL